MDRHDNNIEIDHKERCELMDWIHLAEGGDEWGCCDMYKEEFLNQLSSY
jgi:hypothetical protein